MFVCECVFSEDVLTHVKNIQELLKNRSYIENYSDVVTLLLKYVFSEPDILSLDDFLVIDQYFLDNPKFLYSFHDDVMMSATFYFDSKH